MVSLQGKFLKKNWERDQQIIRAKKKNLTITKFWEGESAIK